MHDFILGVGGANSYPEGYLAGVYEKVRAHGGVCVADEVQTGFGRCGSHYWGFQTHGVTPDIEIELILELLQISIFVIPKFSRIYAWIRNMMNTTDSLEIIFPRGLNFLFGFQIDIFQPKFLLKNLHD